MKRSALKVDPEKVRAWQQRSRQRIQPMSDRRRAQLPEKAEVNAAAWERDRGCVLRRLDSTHRCFGPPTPHRLRKGSAGGGYTHGNVVILCAYGNGWVEDYPVEARALGLVVR